MKKILNIEEISNIKLGYYDFYGGYKVETNKDTYLILIDNRTQCCEDLGYFSTNEEDLSYFVGANLLDFKLTDTALSTKKFSEQGISSTVDDGSIQFVDIETSKGVIQLAVYNIQNGYYGHSVLIKKNDEIVLETVL